MACHQYCYEPLNSKPYYQCGYANLRVCLVFRIADILYGAIIARADHPNSVFLW